MFPLFATSSGTPVDLANVANRIIKPMLKAHGMRWKGWHGFRRGLATNLKANGADDMTIMCIIRNGDAGTMHKHYIKTIPAHVEATMKAFEDRLCAGTAQEIGSSDAGNYN
jgi:hypothetical protein